MPFNVNLYNVVLTGVAYLFLFAAFNTASLSSANVLEAAAKSLRQATVGVGYFSLAIVYAAFAIFNWIAAVVVHAIGPKYSMFCGALCYVLFVASFLEPRAPALYLASAINGLGAAVLWTAQGAFITANSDDSTVNKHFSIFWAIFQISQLVGGLYAFLVLARITEIDRIMRLRLYGFLLGCALVGSFIFLLVRSKSRDTLPEGSSEKNEDKSGDITRQESLPVTIMDDKENTEKSTSRIHRQCQESLRIFLRSFHLLRTRMMICILAASAFTGINISFYSSLFASSIGHVVAFGDSAKSYIGLAGVFVGIGEILGSLLSHLQRWVGLDGLLSIFGYPAALTAAFLMFIVMPTDSPIRDTVELGYLNPPRIEVCMVVACLLGVVDSTWNTQLSTLVGKVYSPTQLDVPVAFAIYRCVQSVFTAVTFGIGSHLLLPWQLLIYVIWATLGWALVFWAHDTHIRGTVKVGSPNSPGRGASDATYDLD